MEVPIQETILFKHLFSDTDALKDLGLYHFKNENWNEALKAFINFNNTFEPQPDVLQKIGYCYQQLNNYTNPWVLPESRFLWFKQTLDLQKK